MSNALVEDIFYDPEWSEDFTLPATDNDLLLLTEKLLNQKVPTKVFFQAIAIAAYDGASAFRYANNYIASMKHKNKQKNILLFRKNWGKFDQN